MLGDFTCRVLLQLLGYLYPAYKTFKVVQLPATRSNDTLLRNWCQYWALMAVFTALQPLVDTFCFWLPLYYEAKLALAVYLWANELAGAQHVWARYFHPLVSRYEPVMDQRLGESKAVAREWLHSNTMRLLAVAQARALAWLAQFQAQAQQAAGRMAGGAASPAAAASQGPAEATGAAPAPRSKRSAAGQRGQEAARRSVGDVPSGEEFEGEEIAEDAVAGSGRAGGSPSKNAPAGAGGKAGDAPLEPLMSTRFTAFSLSSFYSSRSSDLQTQDVQAGLKGFPVLLEKDE